MQLFRALAYRDFRLLWAGLAAASTGMYMQQFVLGWYVVQLAQREGVPERAPLYLGIVGFAAIVPGIGAGLFAGVIADRYDRRKILLAVHVAMTVLSLGLAALVMADRASLPFVALLSGLSAGAFAFDIPTRQALVPRLVRPDVLMSAIGLNYAAITGTQFIGPLIGGLLLGPIGVGGVLVVTAAMRLTIIGALLAMSRQPVEARARRNILSSLIEGVTYAYRDAVIWGLVVLFAITAVGRGFQQFLPAVAAQTLHVGSTELSWMLASAGLGSLVGSVITASLGDLRRRGLLFLVLLLAGSLLSVLFALQQSLVPMLLILPVSTAVSQVALALTVGSLQVRASDEYRGRVIGVHLMSVQVAGPLGLLVLGSLGTAIGVSEAIGLVGALTAVIAGAALVGSAALRSYSTAAVPVADGLVGLTVPPARVVVRGKDRGRAGPFL
ncbi:MAG TPA: MFS transporter [Candidatus Limnocylindria bacterium]